MKKIRYLFLAAICFFISISAYPVSEAKTLFDRGNKIIEFFPPSSFGGDIQVWGSASDSDGCVFVATGAGLSVYDGHSWYQPASAGHAPLSLKTLYYDNSSERLYCGGDNCFGYWKRDDYGQFMYHALYSDSIAGRPQMFWRIGKARNCIYFGAKEAVFEYNPRTNLLRHCDTQSVFHFMYVADNRVFVEQNHTLYELDREMQLHQFASGFDDRITSILCDQATKNLYLFRENKGVFLLSQKGTLTALNIETNAVIGKEKIFAVTRTNDGNFVVGTIMNGIYTIDVAGRILTHVNNTNGLACNSVLSLTTDFFGNVWMGLEGGVAKLNNTSCENYVSDYHGDIGCVYTVFQDKSIVDVGTNKGIYQLKRDNWFSLIPHTQGQTWSINRFGNMTLVCHDAGMLQLTDAGATKIYGGDGVWSVCPIPQHPHYYLSANYHGFSIFREQKGKLRFVNTVANYRGEARLTAFDKNNYLWTMVSGIGFYRFILSDDLCNVTSKLYKIPDMKGICLMFRVDGELIYYANGKTYHYDSLKDALVWDEYAQSLVNLCGTNLIFFHQYDNRFWYISDQKVGYLVRNHNDFKIHENIFEGVSDKQIPYVFRNINRLDDSTFAYGLQNSIGLFRENSTVWSEPESHLKITGIEVENENRTEFQKLNVSKITIPSTYEHIRVSFAGLSKNRILEYQINESTVWKLVKVDKSFDLPHFSSGSYTVCFRPYRQKNADPITLHLNIKKYWAFSALTVLFIIILVILICVLILFLYRRRTRKLLCEKEIHRLAELELLEKNRLESELRDKDKKLMSFMMGEMNKNNLLNHLKTSLDKAAQDQTDPQKAIQSCIRDIDKQLNSKEDWKIFLKYFNTVYDGFLDKLSILYPVLTINDLKLCAYLKLNLSTKDIAVLLSISPNSVDTARYRLRRKLGLTSSDNITTFLLKI